jgi:negative regulator of flagellin synthesis FlgM
MEIGKLAAYSAQNAQKADSRVNTEQQTVVGKNVSAGADRVEFSKSYTEMARMKKTMTENDDIRTEQVERLRTMVQNGTYEVQPDKIAEKMLDALW